MNLVEKFDLADIALVPETISFIENRSSVITRDKNNYLPIINAPMYSIINDESFNNFEKTLKENGIVTCLPRTNKNKIYNTDENAWSSITLEEAEKLLTDKSIKYNKKPIRILIDIANGHMNKLLKLVKSLKDKFGDKIILMVGNIGNPETFRELSIAGADYVRVGIGGGSVCLTSTQTAIHYPLGSLLFECYSIKKYHDFKTKIVADGGISSYSDIVKCLALGADLVMIGKLLAQSLESDNSPYLFKKIKITNKKIANWLFKKGFPLYKKHWGMSTKEAQKQMGKTILKTSEGTTRYYKVSYNLNTWVSNLDDYLKSAMSYCNANNLELFKESNFIILSNNTINKINK